MSEGGSILLVNDWEDDIGTLLPHLEKNYHVETALNGKEALQKVYEFLPDLIVSAVDMKIMDGYELCRKIRAIPRLENVPFIFISADGKSGEDTIKGLRIGADDFVNRPIIPDEMMLRIDVILKRLKILRKLTITDEITNLFNRRYFDQRLDEEVERLKRYERPVGVFIIDVDNFKEINDTYGHAVGDIVLKSVSGLILDSLRKSDVLARYGGDEFGVILPEHTNEAISATAERLRAAVADAVIKADEHELTSTVSIGGVWISAASRCYPSEIVRIADVCLYKAKQNGRNRVELEMLE